MVVPVRGRAIVYSTWAPALLAAVPIALVIVHFGLRNHYHFADESIGAFGGRQVLADFPAALWDPHFSSRPLERLMAWVFAVSYELTPTTAGAFQLAHAIQAAFMATLTVPVALLARALGVPRGWAVAAGVLAAFGPFTIAATNLLNNAPGVTAMAWVLVAAQRAAIKPGWRSDLVLLLAGVLAGVARGGNFPLVVGLAPAIVSAAWIRGGGVRGFAHELVHRHWLLLVVAAGAVVLYADRGFAGVFGTYGAGRSTYVPWSQLGPGLRILGGHLAVGTGLIAIAFAVPWMIRGALRPLTVSERVFALNAIGVSLVFAYVYAPALNEDRYFFVLAPIVAVCFVHALTTRRLGVGWLVPGVALLAFLLARGTAWPSSPDAFAIVPTSQWWNRVITGRASLLPLYHHWMLPLGAAIVAFGLGLLLITRLSRSVGSVVAAATLGLMLLSQAAGGAYVMDQWTDQRGIPALTFADRTSIDRALPSGKSAVLVRANPTHDPLVAYNWDDEQYFNRRIEGTIDVDGDFGATGLGAHTILAYDRATGAVTSPVLSEYLATPVGPEISFAGRTVAVAPATGFRVDRITRPARLAFVATAIRPTGVRLRLWPRNVSSHACLSGHFEKVGRASVDHHRVRIIRGTIRQLIRMPNRTRIELDLRQRESGASDVRLIPCPPGP